MVRERLTHAEIERGRRLGRLLREARGERTAVEVAAAAHIAVETVRKIERGHVPTPAFFTVLALAKVCGVSLDKLAELLTTASEEALLERPA